MEEQSKRFGLEIVNQEIVEVKGDGPLKSVRTSEASYSCKAVIVSTGAEYRKWVFLENRNSQGEESPSAPPAMEPSSRINRGCGWGRRLGI